MTGFRGYFEAILYNEISFSTVPGRKKNDAANSWFPMYIPVQNPIRCAAGSILKLDVFRHMDEAGSWYEWKESVILVNFVINFKMIVLE